MGDLTWTLPGCLLLLGTAISELGRFRVAGQSWPLPLLVTAVMTGTLFARGPLPEAYTRPNAFTHHDDFQVAY